MLERLKAWWHRPVLHVLGEIMNTLEQQAIQLGEILDKVQVSAQNVKNDHDQLLQELKDINEQNANVDLSVVIAKAQAISDSLSAIDASFPAPTEPIPGGEETQPGTPAEPTNPVSSGEPETQPSEPVGEPGTPVEPGTEPGD